MSEETIKSKFEELNMTKDELNRFSEAMKKEEFRKLLVEYAEEISDPKNRELYEKEITALEEERGQNVIFIHPEPGFCMKTTQNGKKCFINICKNANIDKPTSKRETKNVNDKKSEGLVWFIPHTCSPVRDDYDKSGETQCVVYDVVFNPDSYRMGETNERFKNLLKNSAMDTIESSYKVKLDRANAKILKHLNFKGRPTATILRRPAPNASQQPSQSTDELIKPLMDQIKQNNLDKDLAKRLEAKNNQKIEPIEVSDTPKHTVPQYKIVHRGLTDMSDYANDLSTRFISSTRPKELSIEIDLPLCKSSQTVILDIFEQSLHLESNEPNYLLDLNLPFPVKEKEAKAKFDKSKRCLNVTLPVVEFISKIDDEDYYPPSPSVSQSSNLSVTESPNTNYVPQLQVPTPIDSPIQIKYTLPDSFELNETNKSINLKLKINNYIKDSIDLKFESKSMMSFKCESCSKHGSYIKYYSALVEFKVQDKAFEFINLDLSNDLYEIVCIDDEYFEVKIKKSISLDSANKQANVKLNKDCVDSLTIDINHVLESDDSNANENNNNNNFENMNKMSKKDFILNFKNNSESQELDEDDDVDEDDSDQDQDEDEEEEEEEEEDDSSPLEKSQNINIPKQFKTDTNVLKDKIEEESEPETLAMTNENEDYETNYLKSQQQTNEDEDEEENSKKENTEPMSLSSSSTNFSNDSSRLKGILKKPRSFSESESNLASSLPQQRSSISSCLRNSFGSSDCNSTSESLTDVNQIKKSVSFNKQVVRNVFKPGSTVNGMRKPNSNKNKKKNKRKRTVSDPSSDATAQRDDLSTAALRPRNMSESSDDNSSLNSNSVQFVLSDDVSDTKSDSKPNEQQKKKKNNKKKKGKTNDENKPKNDAAATAATTAKNPMDLETMISWKNEGRLPSDNPNRTNCSFKFKNKLMNDLDE